MSHTTGPWEAREDYDSTWWVVQSGPVMNWAMHGLSEADARFIAAAPDTLATLEKTAKSLCSITCRRHLGEKTQHGNACERATAAIAKAKGEA